MKLALLKLGDRLYRHAYFLYRPLYGLYKQVSDGEERRFLRQFMRPGMTVIDVGANVGSYTRFLAGLTGPKGRVIAFEPEPLNFARLKANVADLSNVTAVQAAVADREGEIALFVSDDLNVDHRTYDDGRGRRQAAIRAVSLDGFLPPGEPVHLIKLDVQGAEYGVLQGARRVLEGNADIALIMEFWPFGLRQSGVGAGMLLDLLGSMGFSWRRTDGRTAPLRTDALEEWREDNYCNLWVTRDRQPVGSNGTG
ncbi:MAG: FkbM family methyltransferase [Chitinophagaceae bacterium]|nr:FkbM family methyltransferase [Rubrivivax sp.]